MALRGSPIILLTAALALLAAGCGSTTGTAATTDVGDSEASAPITQPEQVVHPPPAEVLDATIVFFDPDSTPSSAAASAVRGIEDAAGLDAFARRYVDGEPAMARPQLRRSMPGRC